MIKITKGNPTSEEIAALLSVLMVARGDTSTPSHRRHGRCVAIGAAGPSQIPEHRIDVTGVGALGLTVGPVLARRMPRFVNVSCGTAARLPDLRQ